MKALLIVPIVLLATVQALTGPAAHTFAQNTQNNLSQLKNKIDTRVASGEEQRALGDEMIKAFSNDASLKGALLFLQHDDTSEMSSGDDRMDAA